MMDFGQGLGVIRSEEEEAINVAMPLWAYHVHVPKVISAMATTRVYGSRPALFILIKTI